MLTLNDGRSELWQWDTGRKLTVDADCTQVHFSNKFFGRSVDVDVVDGVAEIPDVLLQADKELLVWAFVGTAENGYTKISKVFKVNKRNKPADYVFTPTEQTTLDEIKKRLDRIEEGQDPDAIKNAVDEYLANNPIQVKEKDPTVPEWAKQPIKPKYTAKEVGAVATVNGKTPDENGNVEITIPDSGGNVDLTGYAKEQWVQQNYQPKGEYLTAVPDGYAKTEDIPTKPEDIGAQPSGNYALKTEIPSIPVQSVNGKTGAVKLSASDVGARPDNWMPSAQEVGALPNTYTPPNQTAAQVGADPKGTAASAVSQHNVDDDSHNDIRLELKAINDKLTAFFDSDNQTLDELSEIVAYITSNKALIDSITTSKVSVADIVNNLTSNVSNKPLSAAQGVVLKGLIDTLSNSLANYQPKGDYALRSELPNVPTKLSAFINDSGFITGYTETDPTVPVWAKQPAKPSYSKSEVGLGNVDNVKQYSESNPPPYPVTSVNGETGAVSLTIPTVPTKVSAFENDKGYLTQHQDISGLAKKSETVSVNAQTLTEAQKAQVRENIGVSASGVADGSITPEKTSFIVCEGTGETVTERVPNFTNLANPKSSDWKTDTRFSSSTGNQSAMAGAIVTNAIPCIAGDIVRIKGIKGGSGTTANALFQVVGYTDEAGTVKCSTTGLLFEKTKSQSNNGIAGIVTVEDGVTTWTAYTNQPSEGAAAAQSSGFSGAVSFRVAGVPVTTVDDIIITVNEPITYTEVTSGGKSYTLDEKISVPHANGLKSGAKWFALGDSITQGYVSAVDASASNGYKQYLNTNVAERWVNIVADKNGYELTNYGVGGTGYAHHTSSTVNARAQVANIDFSKCDLVTLAYGVNDWKGKATLGSMDDDVETVDAFVPNMRYVIKKILADNPYCKIFVITPLNCRSLGTYDTNFGINYAKSENASGPGLEDIFQLEKSVCEYHGIELIDMTHCSIINRENIKTMLPDYVHPTVKCHAVMARELAKKIAFQ